MAAPYYNNTSQQQQQPVVVVVAGNAGNVYTVKTPLPPARPFSWPHGIIVFIRLLLHVTLFMCKMLFITALPGISRWIDPVFGWIHVILFLGFGCVEATFTWFYFIHSKRFWSYSLLFYPFYVPIYIHHASNASAWLYWTYGTYAYLNQGILSSFGTALISVQLVLSILLIALFVTHYLVKRTWALAVFDVKYLFGKVSAAAEQQG